MFIAALFIIANFCAQLWYIPTMEYYYSALKRNELSSHKKTGRNLMLFLNK